MINTAITKNNNKINLIEINNQNYDKTILIIGVFHGEEPQGEYLINEYLKKDLSKIKNRLLIVPCLNPDGKALNAIGKLPKIKNILAGISLKVRLKQNLLPKFLMIIK